MKRHVLDFKDKNIFQELHTSQLLDRRLEKLKSALLKKYGVDYLSVQVVDKTTDYYFRNFGHDKWHEYCWDLNLLSVCPALPKTKKLSQDENYISFFLNFRTKRGTDLRADIIGELKEGSSILFYNEKTGNKVQFCITFIKGISINTLNKKIFFSLMNDLYSARHILDPFMDYFKTYKVIIDSPELILMEKQSPFIINF